MVMVTQIRGLNYQGWEVEKNGENARHRQANEVSKGINGGILQCKASRSFYPLETECGTLTLKRVSKLGSASRTDYGWYFDVKLDEKSWIILSLNQIKHFSILFFLKTLHLCRLI